MEPNPILAEIRRTRDELAHASGYDLQNLVARLREHETAERAKGAPFAEPPKESNTLREEPPKD